MSKLGCTDIHFIESGIKVNGAYYRDNLLAQKLLPDMAPVGPGRIFFVFQQDGAPAHRARFPGARDAGLHSSNTLATDCAGRLQYLECTAGEDLPLQDK